MKQQDTKQTILTGTVVTRAITYGRVSGDDSKYSTSGIEGQLADCRKYATDKGYNVVAEMFEDPDKMTSGADWLPELQKILALAEKGAFDVLVVREIDRLARNRFKQMSVENHLEAHGVRVEYVIGQYADTSEGKLLKGLMSEFAEFERNKIKERTQRGRVNAVKAGKIPATALTFGYTIEDGQMVINEYEAGIVQSIFDMYVNRGQSLREIVDWLDSNGVAKPGKRACHLATIDKEVERGWMFGTVGKMLDNETYTGKWFYGKTRKVKDLKTGRKKSIKRPKSEWLMVEVPAIVSEEIFRAAQERRKGNQKLLGSKNRKNDYLLGGMLTCRHCNKAVHGSTINLKAPNGGTSYYVCDVCRNPRMYSGLTCDNQIRFRADVVDSIVWDWVRLVLIDRDKREAALREWQEGEQQNAAPILKMIETNEAKLKDLQAQKSRLIQAFKAGVLSLEELTSEKGPVDKQIKDLQGAIEKLRGDLSPDLLTDEEIEDIHKACEELHTGVIVADDSFEGRRNLLIVLRTKVTLYMDNGEKWVHIACVLGQERIAAKSHTTLHRIM